MKTNVDVNVLTRIPAMCVAMSLRINSTQNRPTQYAATYSANSRPWPILKRRSTQISTAKTRTFQSSSYRNVGCTTSTS